MGSLVTDIVIKTLHSTYHCMPRQPTRVDIRPALGRTVRFFNALSVFVLLFETPPPVIGPWCVTITPVPHPPPSAVGPGVCYYRARASLPPRSEVPSGVRVRRCRGTNGA